MLMFGPKVTDNVTPLRKINIRQMVAMIRKPNTKLANFILYLRKLHSSINQNAYKERKILLPYVVPSIFSPPLRRKVNFAYSEHLIIDLDKLSVAGIKPSDLKERLKKDSRIEVMFVSPSEDGLKIFVRLQQRINDASQYSTFYKIFTRNFAREHELMQFVDMRTNDPTRACFLSFDPEIYYNPNAEKVAVGDFEETESLEFPEEAKKAEKEIKKQTAVKKKKDDIDREVLVKIKQKLDPNYRPRPTRRRIITVPDQMEIIEQKIRDFIESELPQVKLANVKDINYGKQFLFNYELKYAEFNIFFGKNGITILKTNKKINDLEFQELMYQVLIQLLL